MCLPSKAVCANIIAVYKYVSDCANFGSQSCSFELTVTLIAIPETTLITQELPFVICNPSTQLDHINQPTIRNMTTYSRHNTVYVCGTDDPYT
jgi:hypothetical protein